MIKIDGTVEEGGGSILRVAAPISLASGIPLSLTKIRANRKSPGLKTQHLEGLNLLASMGSSELIGAYLGSSDIQLMPGEISEGKYSVALNTAASVPLIAQVVLHLSVAAKRSFQVFFKGGGTHVNWSPSTDYLRYALAPALAKFGVDLNISVDRFGFFPKGGASGNFSISSSPMDEKVQLGPGKDGRVIAVASVSASLRERAVAERMLDKFVSKSDVDVETIVNYLPSVPGAALTVVRLADLPVSTTMLGNPRMSSEQVGLMAAHAFTKIAMLDDFIGDQLLVPLAFSKSGSYIYATDTPHLRSNLYVIKQLLGEIFQVNRVNSLLKVEKVS